MRFARFPGSDCVQLVADHRHGFPAVEAKGARTRPRERCAAAWPERKAHAARELPTRPQGGQGSGGFGIGGFRILQVLSGLGCHMHPFCL